MLLLNCQHWTTCGLKAGTMWTFDDCFFLFCLLFSTDKFKGGKAELNQTKSCVDLDELREMLKASGSER